MGLYLKFLDRFRPVSSGDNDWLRRRSIITALLLISAGASLLAPFYFLFRSHIVPAEIFIFAVIIIYPIIGSLVTLRAGLLASLIFSNIGGVLCVTALAVYTGGLKSFALVLYIAILSLLSGFSSKKALVSTLFMIIAALSALFLLEVNGSIPAFNASEPELKLLHFLFLIAVALVLGSNLLTGIDSRTRSRRHLRHAREVAEEQKLLAEKASKAKSEFLAAMSHELRTPMNGVIGMTELLEGSTELSEQQRRYTSAIRQSGRTLLFLIDDILDYIDLESSRVQIKPEEFSLQQVIESVYEVHALVATESGLNLTYDNRVGSVDHYVGDKGRLLQILTNLVNNAIKFTDEGIVNIRCMDDVQKIGRGLRFEVEDSGSGVPTETVPMLFQSFSQADQSASREHSGSGLGLAICKQLVELMGGVIGYSVADGGGSLFWLEVPVHAIEDSVWKMNSDDNFLENARIMIVSGNKMQVSFFSPYAGRQNIHFYALDQMLKRGGVHLEKVHPEVIIFELATRDISAELFIQLIEIERKFLTFPILVLSSQPMASSRLALKLINTRHHLMDKPANFSQIARALSDLTKRYAAAVVKNGEGVRFVVQADQKHQTGQEAFAEPHLKVLIAEDNPINQTLIQTMLNRMGLINHVVSNGEEAVKEVCENSYDLVLMDLQMPQMDGITAAREIRRLPEQKRHIPIIALSANATVNDRERCLNAGMNEFIAKPYTVEELQAKVGKFFPV